MRLSGVLLLLLGLVAAIVCGMNGCSSFFGWNGRHPVDTRPLGEERDTKLTFVTTPGRRYTLAVQVVFDPARAPERDGTLAVEAKLSLVVRARDAVGTVLTETTGWLDPAEPPNVLYTHRAGSRAGAGSPELMVERLVGPFMAATAAPVTIEVDLGPDRVGQVPILARRVVIHDDALPGSIRTAALAAGAGTIVAAAGLVLLLLGWWRSRGRRKRSGIPRRDVV